MAKKKTKKKPVKQKVTLFSNDADGVPFLTVDKATAMIRNHVNYYMPFLLKIHMMEDIVQTVLMRMCQFEYRPSESAPNTFALRLIQSKVGHLMVMACRKKNTTKEVPHSTKPGETMYVPMIPMQEQQVNDVDGETRSSLDFRPNEITPEDEALANELIAEYELIPDKEKNKWLKEKGFR